jgi:aldehyde dehydrogenase (NAD+)
MNRAVFENQRLFFLSGTTLPLVFRRQALVRLRKALLAREAAFLDAVHQDVGKPPVEAYASEFALVRAEIDVALRHLPQWIRPCRVRTPWLHWPADSRRHPLPRGVVLIISPWNYPLQLCLVPLVSALAAGNCAIVKPSEFAPATAKIISDMIAEIFPPAYCCCVSGDARTAAGLLEFPWDHIFFTGSTRVGRLIMQAAAGHLASVTLELGGKNPCLVLKDADLAIAAERIAWGKFLNAGQTCGAPDHVYVEEAVMEPMVDALKKTLRRFYGSDPEKSPDYARIVTPAHFDRLHAMLGQGRILFGGGTDRDDRYIAPTLIDRVPENSPLLQEEIFGPLLPLLPFSDFTGLCAALRSKPRPLAAYIFTRSLDAQQYFIERISCGSTAVNDTVSQITSPWLPLGGIGESGQGSYHGRAGFDCFTHYKSVLRQSVVFNNRMKYPPYRIPVAWLRKILPRLL